MTLELIPFKSNGFNYASFFPFSSHCLIMALDFGTKQNFCFSFIHS